MNYIHVEEVENCCGLRLLHNIDAIGKSSKERKDHLRVLLKHALNSEEAEAYGRIRKDDFEGPEPIVASFIVLNKGQKAAYGDVLEEFSYKVIQEFENFNESKQTLFMYFRHGSEKLP